MGILEPISELFGGGERDKIINVKYSTQWLEHSSILTLLSHLIIFLILFKITRCFSYKIFETQTKKYIDNTEEYRAAKK